MKKDTVDSRPIVLIGMTGCGKTSIGRRLASLLGLAFIDTDDMLSSDRGAGELFTSIGEEEFRKIEYSALLRSLEKGRCVIATGGGAPTYRLSYEAIKEKSRPILICRERIDAPLNPPVCGDPHKYKAILSSREPIYLSLAEAIFDNTGIEKTAEAIASYLLSGKKS